MILRILSCATLVNNEHDKHAAFWRHIPVGLSVLMLRESGVIQSWSPCSMTITARVLEHL